MKHKRSFYSEFFRSNRKPFSIWLDIHKSWTRFASKGCKLFFLLNWSLWQVWQVISIYVVHTYILHTLNHHLWKLFIVQQSCIGRKLLAFLIWIKGKSEHKFPPLFVFTTFFLSFLFSVRKKPKLCNKYRKD